MSLLSAAVSPAFPPEETYSLRTLTASPGFLSAAIERSRFQCVPISLTVVERTLCGPVSRFSLRVISGTRAKPLTSSNTGDGDETGAGRGAGGDVALDVYCGSRPALTYSCCSSGLRSSSCG